LPSLIPVPRNKIAIGYVKVVLSEQRVYAYNKRRRLIASFPASTGANDTTPVGRFKVFSKSAQAYYSPNPGERMKFMTRFTKGREGDNIGFHGIPYRVTPKGDIPLYTPLGITPVSHGCVRLKVSDAKWLFQNMALGAEVLVIRSRR
jgi:lipoprotein-anchoring transpeptidase ErfK/SrfK